VSGDLARLWEDQGIKSMKLKRANYLIVIVSSVTIYSTIWIDIPLYNCVYLRYISMPISKKTYFVV